MSLIGTSSLKDDRYRELVYTSVGYPGDVGGPAHPGGVPCVEHGLVVEDIDDSNGGKELEAPALPASPGWSGGPLWASVNGGTTILAVTSSPQKDFLQPTKVMHSGGAPMVDFVRHGLGHFGGAWSEIEENMTAAFGYSKPQDGVAACSWRRPDRPVLARPGRPPQARVVPLRRRLVVETAPDRGLSG